jgi:hypothetical protein
MPDTLVPTDVIAAATITESALRPVVDRDWSVQAGPLEWDVEDTITHMLAAVAKYTVYLASRSERFIALAVTRCWYTPTTPSAGSASPSPRRPTCAARCSRNGTPMLSGPPSTRVPPGRAWSPLPAGRRATDHWRSIA